MMHELLIGLKDIAPAALIAVLSAITMLAAACAAYAVFLILIVPRIETRDPGGWSFAGALTLAVAFLIFQAALGMGKGYETLKDGAVSLGICLGTVVTALLGYHSVKVMAARPPASVTPTTTTTTTTTPTPVAPVTPSVETVVKTETTP